MSLAEHMVDHIKLGLDFRFPAEGNTYFKVSGTGASSKVELYIDGTLANEWTKPV
jgi:hypothetical protein